jgi:uncharacterized membrane protein
LDKGTDISSKALAGIILVSVSILFACSSLRHALFQSSAFDLGYFDQAIYLIAQGKTPIVSFWGYHFLGGHADWILYLLALPYKIYPDIHWLFAVQAAALALAALPTWHIARQAGLKETQALAIAAVYLLYPLVFNLNLFDFHPEVMALPALLGAILAARQGRTGWFWSGMIFILGCRDALSLTVAAMGFWLLVFERKRWYGAIALFAGSAWFLIATQVIIPFFRPNGVEAVGRYAYLGNSVLEIAQNLFLQPGLILGRVFSLNTLEYLALLISPVIWGLLTQHLTAMVAAIPTLVINLLSDSPAQRDLVHQYSLPVLPFLLVAVIASLAAGKAWLRNPRTIVLWSLVFFLALAKYGYFGSIYLDSLDTWQATREAIAQVQTSGGVLTTAEIAPHLTHRQLVKFTDVNSPPTNLAQFDYVLLNVRHPGWQSNREFATSLVERLKNTPEFALNYQRDEVYLFKSAKNG